MAAPIAGRMCVADLGREPSVPSGLASNGIIARRAAGRCSFEARPHHDAKSRLEFGDTIHEAHVELAWDFVVAWQSTARLKAAAGVGSFADWTSILEGRFDAQNLARLANQKCLCILTSLVDTFDGDWDACLDFILDAAAYPFHAAYGINAVRERSLDKCQRAAVRSAH